MTESGDTFCCIAASYRSTATITVIVSFGVWITQCDTVFASLPRQLTCPSFLSHESDHSHSTGLVESRRMGCFYPLRGCGFASRRVCGDCFSFCLHHDYLSHRIITDPLTTAISRLGSSVSYSTVSSPDALLLLYWRTVQFLSHYLESWTLS